MRPSVAFAKSNSASNTEERNVRPRIECSLPPLSSWIELFDKITNKWYYYNKDTKVSQWEKPLDLIPSWVPPGYGTQSSNFSAQKQHPCEAFIVNPLRSWFDFPREYPSQPSKLLGEIHMENNPEHQDMSSVSGIPPVNAIGSNSDLESGFHLHLKAASDKLKAHPDILYFDGNLPSPWWELYNETAGIRYYWHSVLNATQSERPSCLAPIQPCSMCGSNIQRGIEQTQQHQELQARTETNNQQDKWVAVSPIRTLEPRSATKPDTNLGSKESLYLSFYIHGDGCKKWYYVGLGGNINENGSRHELITNVLDEVTYRCGAFTVLNSSIYMIADKSRGSGLPYFMLQVLETRSLERPSWKELTPLAKKHIQPWVVSMGGKIYVVGVENKGNNTFAPHYELNEIEVLSDLESCKWEKLPVRSLRLNTLSQYYVLAFEDENKLVIGSGTDKFLYLYDVSTHDLEMLDFVNFIGNQLYLPPVLVGNRLFKFSSTSGILTAYDLVERCIWQGKIDGLHQSFFQVNCNTSEYPVLIHLGGDKLCLVCLKSSETKDISCSYMHLLHPRI